MLAKGVGFIQVSLFEFLCAFALILNLAFSAKVTPKDQAPSPNIVALYHHHPPVSERISKCCLRKSTAERKTNINIFRNTSRTAADRIIMTECLPQIIGSFSNSHGISDTFEPHLGTKDRLSLDEDMEMFSDSAFSSTGTVLDIPEYPTRTESEPNMHRNFSCPSPIHRSESCSLASVSSDTSQERRCSLQFTKRDSQHSLASVLYKSKASHVFLQDFESSSSGGSSGRVSPEPLDEVTVAARALRSGCVEKQTSAANTIVNLSMKAEYQERLVESGAVECMIEIASTTSSRELQRFIAMTICRLTQNGSLVPKISEMKDFFPSMIALCKNPNGTIWRQASRTLALCIVHSRGDDSIVSQALPFVRKLALADQAEFQVDALRALFTLSSGPHCLSLCEGDFGEKLFQIAQDASVPCLIQLTSEILLNICKSGGTELLRTERSVAVVEVLLAKCNPLCERSLKELSFALSSDL